MADNNYCACNSGESKYTIKLNQQGPAGKKGEQGDKGIPGFSPYISVVQSDDENYILRINNEANSYNTPNLFPKEQITTWTNNIEAQVNQNTTDISNIEAQVQQNTTDLSNIKPQVQQNTTDLSKINNNFVTLNSDQEIGSHKTFTENLRVGLTEKNGFKFTSILLKSDLYNGISGIVFHNPNGNPEKPDTYLSYYKNVGICYYKNQYNGSIGAGDLNELAVKGDLPKLATTTTAGIVKPDGTTVTITDDGVISAVGEVTQQELADGLALKVNLTDYNNRVGSLESTVGEQAQTIATLQENNNKLLEMINALKDRVTALETMIDGGNA